MSTSPAFTSPPLSPASQHRRERVLKEARKRGWLTAPRARQVTEAALAALTAGTLPEVPCLKVPELETNDEVDDLCDGLNRVLDWGVEDGTSSDDEDAVRLKGERIWLERGSFERGRDRSSQRLLRFFDDEVLGGKLLGDTVDGSSRVTVSWSTRLYKTAGLTYMKRRAGTGERTATIELSVKVVDEPARLYNTLAHEMCHAATWIVDECAKPPHGAVFKSWARRFARWDASLQITTCHDYAIRYKFNYECVECGQSYGRHSRSINTSKQVCGRCKGALTLLKP